VHDVKYFEDIAFNDRDQRLAHERMMVRADVAPNFADGWSHIASEEDGADGEEGTNHVLSCVAALVHGFVGCFGRSTPKKKG
jgi:hypothetical protein